MKPSQVSVVVAGAGIVGASAALALADLGMTVTVVEPRAAQPFDAMQAHDLRVFAISPGTARWWQTLGVWDAILAMRASPYRDMRVWENEADLHFHAGLIGQYELGWIIEQQVLQFALRKKLQAHPRIRLLEGQSIVQLDLHEHAVAVDISAHPSMRADLLIAADGANSPIRQMAGIEVKAIGVDQSAIVAHVSTEHAHQETAWQRFLPSGPLAFLPLSDGRCSIVWSLDNNEHARVEALDDAGFESELSRALDHRLGHVRLSTQRVSYPLRTQLATSMVKGRVVLMGDAAHVVHPLAGQGLNLGLQDGMTFTQTMQNALQKGHDPADPRVLARYARLRESANARAAASFVAIKRGFGNPAWWLERLRSESLGLLNQHPIAKRWLAMEASGLS